ncbi:MAG: hypothetical protein R3B84_24775 [Zavarzinella sp.]
MVGPESACIETSAEHGGLRHQVRGFAVGSFSMAVFSMFTWWIYPMGMLLAVAACGLATLSIILGNRTPAKGLYYALGAIFLAQFSIGHALLTARFVNMLFLEYGVSL